MSEPTPSPSPPGLSLSDELILFLINPEADVFPDPFSFDIDRYRPERSEHRSPGYAPYGLGTHTCLGSRWMDLQLAVNVLMIAHHFTLEVSPPNFRFRFNPLPSMKPSWKLRFRIAEQHREITV